MKLFVEPSFWFDDHEISVRIMIQYGSFSSAGYHFVTWCKQFCIAFSIFFFLSYLSHSLADRWGTTVDFTTSFLHSSWFSAFRGMMFHSRPVRSNRRLNILSMQRFFECDPATLKDVMNQKHCWKVHILQQILMILCRKKRQVPGHSVVSMVHKLSKQHQYKHVVILRKCT